MADVNNKTEDKIDGSEQKTDQSQESITQKDTKSSDESNYTKEKIDELLAKARKDEKTKVFSQLEKLRSQKEASDSKVSELEQKLALLETDLDSIRKGKTTELDSVAKELSSLRETNKKLEKAVEEVATSATEQIRQAKLEAYRDKIIAEKGLLFAEAIKGSSEEEILESANAALEKQKIIEQAAREKALEEARAAQTKNLPKPIVVDGQLGKGPGAGLSALNRESLARLPKSEYQKQRDQLLMDAKRKVGLLE